MTQYKQQPEFKLQTQVCKYILLQYPDVCFSSDTIGSLKLTERQAKRNYQIQKPDFKTPDVHMYEARRGYIGCFIELKVVSPFLKDGSLSKNKHIQAQEKSMAQLRSKGYYAVFSWDLAQTIKVIDWYLMGPKTMINN